MTLSEDSSFTCHLRPLNYLSGSLQRHRFLLLHSALSCSNCVLRVCHVHVTSLWGEVMGAAVQNSAAQNSSSDGKVIFCLVELYLNHVDELPIMWTQSAHSTIFCHRCINWHFNATFAVLKERFRDIKQRSHTIQHLVGLCNRMVSCALCHCGYAVVHTNKPFLDLRINVRINVHLLY